MDPLELLADLLWSDDGAAGAGRQHVATDATTTRFLAVPSRAHPRYLLPLDVDRRAQRRLLMAYNDLRSPGRRLARRALAQVAGRGLLPRSAAQQVRTPASVSGQTLLTVVANGMGVAPRELTMAIGVNDKGGLVRPTITVADRAGTPRLFVKVARHPQLQRRLINEHQALQEMERHPVPGLVTPRAILLEEWAGRTLLGVSPLPLESVGMRFRHQAEADVHMERLHASRAPERTPLGDAAWAEVLRARMRGLQDSCSKPLVALLDRVLDRHADDEIELGRRHGDWSPWNMARLDRGRIAVWDWEFYESPAPTCLDRLNWVFAYATSVRGVPAEVAARDLAQRHDTDALGVTLFLLDMAVRRAEEGACGLESSAAASRQLQGFLHGELVSDRP